MKIHGRLQGLSHNSLFRATLGDDKQKPENVVHIFSFLALLLFRIKSSMARNRNFHVLQICMRTQVRLVNLISKWKGEGRGGGIDRNAIRDRF